MKLIKKKKIYFVILSARHTSKDPEPDLIWPWRRAQLIPALYSLGLYSLSDYKKHETV